MNILCVGDIVGKTGRSILNQHLAEIKEELQIDLAIVNAENAAGGAGVTPRIADQLFRFGCDVLTLGDHTWDRPELMEYLDHQERIIRPANFSEDSPGRGWCVAKSASGIKIGVINLLGRVFIRYNTDCPFRCAKKIVEKMRRETKNIIVDFHAEATSEKIAFGFYMDGLVSGVFGTHTHIQTADERVLSGGTAYITDLGMTGPYDSVIGQHKEKVIQRFVTGLPARFEVAKAGPELHGVVIDLDDQTGQARGIERVMRFYENAPDEED